MKKIIHVLFILFTITCKSQTIDIIGSIADSTTKSKLPYGNIILKNNEDSILTNILSNDKGEFIFKNISYQKGMYLLTRYMGYNDKRFDFAFNNDSKINIGVINIIPNATQIKEATIVGNINVVEQKFDKKIFTMNEGKIVAARSVLDLLRTMPGVVVSDDGNIRYKGATATIYVDDQPVENLYPKIEMVPVDKVEKIELIDAAMQTGGSGRGGIINIKLKSIKNDGLSGLVSSKLNSINLENIDKSEEFININYKHKKLTVINNFSYGNNIDNLNSITNQNFNALGVSAIKYFDLNRNDKSDDFNEYIGFVYKSSDNTRINLGGGIYQKKTSVISTLNSFTEIEDKETLNMFSENEFINYNLKYKGFRCSYWHKFDTNDTYLRVFGGLQFINYPSTVNRNYNYTILNSLNTDSIYRTNMQAMEKEDPSVFCSFFYNKSFFKESHWNLSYYFWSFLNNTYTVQYYILDKLFLPQTWSNNYSQQGHYLSWRIGTKIKKWKIDGGINLRDFFVKGNKYFYDITNHDTAIKINNNYLKFLPSATIALTINEAKEVKLTFSKTSDSPYFWDLTGHINFLGTKQKVYEV
ncbi:MAG TPA: hypothetical protein PKK00_14360 [Bacteroidales bacterium]|nr:hypothetical protein [Bacteroidales bacterium]HPS18395.1 hypothetical protein [Bacteroidales bacterium]